MADRLWNQILTKSVVALALTSSFLTSSIFAQESPSPRESFDVEPPLLVQPGEPDPDQPAMGLQEPPVSVEGLKKQLERARESAASAERLVKTGVLAKVEAERRALRAVRLEAELTNAQLTVAKEQVAAQKKRLEAGEIGKGDFDASVVALAGASAAAQTGDAKYRQAQLDAAALNLRRQKQLLAAGSARKSDVARAEDKLAALQLGEQKP